MAAERPRRRDLRRFLRESLLGRDAADDRDRLLRLLEVNRLLVSEREPRRLLGLILDEVIALTGAERAFLVLKGGEGTGRVEIARNLDREAVRSPDYKISHTIADRVMRSGETLLTDSASDDAEFGKLASVAGLQLRSILCAPLRYQGRVVGCIYLDHRFREGEFGAADRRLLELFADQAAVAVENARLHAENEHQRTRLEELNAQLSMRVREQEEELRTARARLERAESLPPPKYDYSDFVGRSPAVREVFRLLDIVAETDYPVLILGESGTGKELVARAIVKNGRRADRPFLKENCAALAENLLESELFGYVKGAFTGADRDRRGLFEQADGGTLFLDEIGETPPTLQQKLLRVLQEGEFRKVGATRPTKVDVRILCATNRDLPGLVREGRFREDLFYRLKVMTIRLPPLRERREDVPLLVEHVLERISRETGEERRRVTRAAMRRLVAYDWPGNVRELENELRRMAALAVDGEIDVDLVQTLFEGDRPLPREGGFAGLTLAEIEKRAILEALERAHGNRSQAARALGLPRRTFYNRLRKYGIR